LKSVHERSDGLHFKDAKITKKVAKRKEKKKKRIKGPDGKRT